MAVRKTWGAEQAGIGSVLRYLYRNDVPSGDRYAVSLRFAVTEGPQEGREVATLMTPDEARAYAARILARADMTEKMNKDHAFMV